MGGTNGLSKPANDGGFVLGVCFVICRAAPLGWEVDAADGDDDGVAGKR